MSDIAQRIANLSPEKRALLEAKLLEKRKLADRPSGIPRRAGTEPCRLSFAQERLWFIEQMRVAGSAYHIPIYRRLRGPLDVQATAAAVRGLVQRHEVLRSTYASEEGQPLQKVVASSKIDVPIVDLRSLPAAERESEERKLVNEERRRPFDLERDPMRRARLLRLADDEHWLLLTLHHIASDGWSVGIVLRELSALYQACSKGEPSPLAELPVQYADYAIWQRDW